ncbi:SRPBCC domain-containing protein [Tumebacillus sp. DT12]|uniref:SRPBCC domain-containing protein n=1 Tax=Tumebacillus lacus TaxID=2995335 RepID=A0ABT3WX26_9BACL|nr:SRPBCC domain-containing protein [Tumebacillus lacus]MCX7568766.1 SRPBCC domain-containing protein [Tumebacillus lacus]
MQHSTVPDIRHTYVYAAPIQKVWEAVSTSEGLSAWFMKNDIAPVLGHTFTIHSPYGDQSCEVTVVEPPTRLAFTWGTQWLITIELEEQADGKTEVTLTHSGWVEEMAANRERMNHGWQEILDQRLRLAVESA